MGEATSGVWRRHARLTGALLLASAVCVALVVARVAWTGRPSYSFMVKNLILAWIPLVCALGACAALALRARGLSLVAWAALWLVFFPNAPYLMTDLVHLRARDNPLWWYDLIALPFFAWTGLALGFASLYLMERTLAQRFGNAAAWSLSAAAVVLGAFGIQLGRFGRFNSWDVVARPDRLLAEIADTLIHPWGNLRELAFTGTLAVVLAAAYLVLLAFVRLGFEEPAVTT